MKIATSSSRVRTSFDPELELPKLHQWFAENPHPSRLTLQLYVKELNSLASRQSRKLLEVHNLCYWFKNARAAYKRAELRIKKNHEQQFNDDNPQPLLQQSRQHMQQPSFQPQFSKVSTPNFKRHQSAANLKTPFVAQSSYGVELDGQSISSNVISPSSINQQQMTGCKGLAASKSSPNLSKRLHLQHTQSVVANDEVSRDVVSERGSSPVTKSSLARSARPFGQLLGLDASTTSSSDTGTESPSRGGSTSPSSTGSNLTPSQTGVSNGINLALPSHHHQSQHHQSNLGSIDLASAVNCLLSTASNFTAAAAAAAAAAASTNLNPGSIPQNANLLQGPSSAAINLAATLLNSNLIQAGASITDTNSVANAAAAAVAIAAARNPAAAAALASNPALAAAAALAADQPMRHLFTAFSPSSYQFALGVLDNKVLDSNILSAMTFPTSACAPDAGGSIARYSLANANTSSLYPHFGVNLHHNHHHRTRLNGSRDNGL